MLGSERRVSNRRTIDQQVRCVTSAGPLPEVWLVDLSVSGCQVVMRGGTLIPGQALVVRPETLEALSATVRWVKESRAGLAFDHPLHESVFDHLVKSKVDPKMLASLGSTTPVDRFGRPMPQLQPLSIRRSVA